MKRSISVAAAAAIAVLVCAVGASATANVDSGTYKGKVSRKNPQTGKKPVVTFKVTGSKKLRHFTHKGLYMKCSDGKNFTLGDKFDSGRKRLTISDNGHFSFFVTYKKTGGRWDVAGRISHGNRAKGTLKMTVRFTSDNVASPHGKIRCHSGKVKWSAKH